VPRFNYRLIKSLLFKSHSLIFLNVRYISRSVRIKRRRYFIKFLLGRQSIADVKLKFRRRVLRIKKRYHAVFIKKGRRLF
jgi:hypothetical protein